MRDTICRRSVSPKGVSLGGGSFEILVQQLLETGQHIPVAFAARETVKGTLFCGGVWHAGEIKGSPKLQEAYEMGRLV